MHNKIVHNINMFTIKYELSHARVSPIYLFGIVILHAKSEILIKL
jgi:hypothetical protein